MPYLAFYLCENNGDLYTCNLTSKRLDVLPGNAEHKTVDTHILAKRRHLS